MRRLVNAFLYQPNRVYSRLCRRPTLSLCDTKWGLIRTISATERWLMNDFLNWPLSPRIENGWNCPHYLTLCHFRDSSWTWSAATAVLFPRAYLSSLTADSFRLKSEIVQELWLGAKMCARVFKTRAKLVSLLKESLLYNSEWSIIIASEREKLIVVASECNLSCCN